MDFHLCDLSFSEWTSRKHKTLHWSNTQTEPGLNSTTIYSKSRFIVTTKHHPANFTFLDPMSAPTSWVSFINLRLLRPYTTAFPRWAWAGGEIWHWHSASLRPVPEQAVCAALQVIRCLEKRQKRPVWKRWWCQTSDSSLVRMTDVNRATCIQPTLSQVQGEPRSRCQWPQ